MAYAYAYACKKCFPYPYAYASICLHMRNYFFISEKLKNKNPSVRKTHQSFNHIKYRFKLYRLTQIARILKLSKMSKLSKKYQESRNCQLSRIKSMTLKLWLSQTVTVHSKTITVNYITVCNHSVSLGQSEHRVTIWCVLLLWLPY